MKNIKISEVFPLDIIPISKPSITEKELEYVTDAINSGWISSAGKYIEMFEESFALYSDTKFAVATSNGTTALHLALVALGIQSGDEVIVPDLTFIATANAVHYTGAKVVLVDIDRDTLCIDPECIKKAITSKTKAIIPVHLYGHPANMNEINKIAKQYRLFVIEDAAEAHGAEFLGKRVGGLSDAGVFSFYGNKIITTGEGGMITTNDEKFYNKLKVLRDHGMSLEKKYWHTEVGFNYRMTNLQAALGLAQLERINELLAKKKEIFEWYQTELSGLTNLRLNYQADWAKNVYWMVCVEILNFDASKRDKLLSELKRNGVDVRPFFYPISDMPIYKKADTPVSHEISKRGFNLPSYFDLTYIMVQKVCKILKKEIKTI